MQLYQHRFDRVEGYVHHRPPYLLVDQIHSIAPQRIVASKQFVGDEFFAIGHFPGAPILPGALMQEMTTQAAGALLAAEYNPMQHYHTDDPLFNEFALGVLVRVKRARYRSFARPGDTLTIDVTLKEHVGDIFEFVGCVERAGQKLMENCFQLTNIPSAVLQGSAAN